MSATESEAPTGLTVAQSLREVADWLDAHPDETVSYAFVRLAAAGREDLERIATAFGDEAREELSYGGDEVQIRRFFGEVEIYGGVRVQKLTDAPPVPEYTPILASAGSER